MAGKEEKSKVYEAVTGRIPLAKFKSIEIKKACTAEGAEYHEAADCFLVTGSLAQVINVKKHINKNGMSSSERSGSSSSEHEKSASPSFQEQYDTQPYLATYIQAFCNEDLKKIQQWYNVVITWASDGRKVQIATSSASGTIHHLKLACDEFIKIYKSLYQSVLKVSFDVKMQIEGFTNENFEMIVCSVSQYVPGLVVEKVDDGRMYNLWGTHTSLENGQEWIRRRLGISSSSPKTRSLSPKTGLDKVNHETPNKLKVVVYKGDITQENSDIIVNACNKLLDHRGGVSFAISKAGGPSVKQESDQYVKQHGHLSTGDVVVTGSGFLKCKKILHAVGPQWKKHKKDGSIAFLQKIFRQIYNIALSLKAKSVAIPAISSGIYGVPKEVCAQTTFSFIDELDKNLASKKEGPFEIRLVNIDPETVTVFRQEFRKWLLKGKNSNDCPICESAMTNPKVLPKCGHMFCKPCIDMAFTYQKKCPICQEVYGITEGDQPDGTMTVHRSKHSSLSGYEGCGYYTINYEIPSGKQDKRHPNPGQWFTGISRQAYLPASKEGEVVLNLLEKAFEKKLIFTVGRSTTSGKENCVTWNDIHHKTSMEGGPQRFGYPDPGYLGRVTDKLKAKGIVPE